MTKKVYIAEYLDQIVTVSVRNSAYPERQQDFVDNIENLQKMNNLKIKDKNNNNNKQNLENKAINFLGSCNNEIIVTEYQPEGTLKDLLETENYHQTHDIKSKINLVIEYVKAINFIHNYEENDDAKHIYCDSHKLDGTTKQFLIGRDFGENGEHEKLKLILSDMDDVPRLDKSNDFKANCKHQDFLSARTDILAQNFLAPEQINQLKTNNNNYNGNLNFNEKSDIYKIPDIAAHIIFGGTYKKPTTAINQAKIIPENKISDQLNSLIYGKNSELASILRRCRSLRAEDRPSSREILQILEESQASFL